MKFQYSADTWWRDWVFWFLASFILGISILHYQTTLTEAIFHDIYRRLYYLPIIIAAFRYQLIGGLGASIIISVIYFPHLLSHWNMSPEQGLNKLLEVVLYNVVGILTGMLVTRQERERQRYETTANQLDSSLQKLRERSQQLLETEENLRVADRLAVLGELTASLAHEVRNPLGSIKGSAKLLYDDQLEKNDKREVADILIREVDRLDLVVENYLNAARTGAKEIHTFQLKQVTDSIQRLLSERIRKRNIVFSIRLPSASVRLTMDMNQLYQILLNILLNAIDAMPDGGTIQLSASLDTEQLHMIVQDEGIGMTPKELTKIWNTFYSTKPQGTGLGLPIVRRMVKNNNGQITVVSERGSGTTVKISLPRE